MLLGRNHAVLRQNAELNFKLKEVTTGSVMLKVCPEVVAIFFPKVADVLVRHAVAAAHVLHGQRVLARTIAL